MSLLNSDSNINMQCPCSAWKELNWHSLFNKLRHLQTCSFKNICAWSASHWRVKSSSSNWERSSTWAAKFFEVTSDKRICFKSVPSGCTLIVLRRRQDQIGKAGDGFELFIGHWTLGQSKRFGIFIFLLMHIIPGGRRNERKSWHRKERKYQVSFDTRGNAHKKFVI